MYVVRRPFRNYNEVLPVGSIVEPEGIKRFKTRLKDRQIVEVTDATFNMWNKYFCDKFGVTLMNPNQEPENNSENDSEQDSETGSDHDSENESSQAPESIQAKENVIVVKAISK